MNGRSAVTTEYRLKSQILDNTRSVWAVVPEDLATPDRLWVLLDAEYYLDAMGGERVVAELLAEHGDRRTVALFVSHAGAEARWRECPCYPDFARFIGDELSSWATDQLGIPTGSGGHLLGGLSYTGLAAAYVALERPDRFGAVLCQSASLWWNDEWLIAELGQRPRVAVNWRVSVGVGETATGVQHAPGVYQGRSQLQVNRSMRDGLMAGGYSLSYHEFDGGHDTVSWEKDLARGLPALLDLQAGEA